MNRHPLPGPARRRWETWIETAVLGAVAAIAAAALLGGCLAEKEEADAGGGGTTWAQLTASGGTLATCASSGCHTSGSLAGNLNLESDQYTAIVTDGKLSLDGTTRIVDPGSSTTSMLFLKVDTGGTMAGYAGGSGAETIGSWIDAGAPE